MEKDLHADYLNLDTKYGKVMRNIARNYVSNIDNATTITENVLKEQVEYINNNILEEDNVKLHLTTMLRKQCLNYLKNIDFTTVVEDDSIANILSDNSKRYDACGRMFNLNDKFENDLKVIQNKRNIIVRIFNKFNDEEKNLFIRYFYYFQSIEQISDYLSIEDTIISKKIKKIRNKFKKLYITYSKEFKVDTSVFKRKNVKYYGMLKYYSDKFSYNKDFLEAKSYLNVDCITDYGICNVLNSLSYAELHDNKEFDIFDEYNIEKTNRIDEQDYSVYSHDFYDEFDIEEAMNNEMSVSEVHKKKNLVLTVLSWTFASIIFVAVVGFTINLLSDTKLDNMIFNNNAIVYSTESEEMGLSFDYYYSDNNEIAVDIKENYFVNNNFGLGITHQVYYSSAIFTNTDFTTYISEVDDLLFVDKTKVGYEDGDIKFVRCKELGLLYIIEYHKGKWKANEIFKIEDLDATDRFELSFGILSKYEYYRDSDTHTLMYSNPDTGRVIRVRFMDDNYKLGKKYYKSDGSMEFTEFYNEDTHAIGLKGTKKTKEDVSKDFVAGIFSFENNNEYLSLYYFYDNAGTYISDFLCRIYIEEFFKLAETTTVGNYEAYMSNIDEFYIYIEQRDEYIFFSWDSFKYIDDVIKKEKMDEINVYGVEHLNDYYFNGYSYIGAEGETTISNLDLVNDKNEKIESFLLYEDNYESIKEYKTNRDKELENIYPEYIDSEQNGIFKSNSEYAYVVYEDFVEIVRYGGGAVDLVIPDTIEGLPVKYIGKNAFSGCSIESVKIPGTVEEIGAQAFSSCQVLSKVVLEEGIKTLGDGVFYDSFSVNDIQFPKSLVMIGENCFLGTLWYDNQSKMENIYIGNILYEYYQKNDETDNSLSISEGTVSIASGAFKDVENINEIILPDSLKYISDYAFSNMDELKYVDFNENVEYIGKYAFKGCGALERITIPGNVKVINTGMFADCKNLRYVEFSEGTSIIMQNVFNLNNKLEGVFIPNSVKSISPMLFDNSNKLIICEDNSNAKEFAIEFDIEYKVRNE